MGDCTTDTAALRSLLETEYAFSQRARSSIRAAFLEYLAEGSLVLHPAPTPGREFYSAAQDSSDQLEWYPAKADLAGSGDLGFTVGPWVYTRAAGGQIHGHFLTIWRRDAACRWRVEFDGGISHGAPASAEPKLQPDQALHNIRDAPPPQLIGEHAASGAMSDSQNTARRDGFAACLRTYARTADFLFYTDGEAPMGLAAAIHYLSGRRVGSGDWTENADGRSADSSLAYAVGVLGDSKEPRTHAYAQIWQYEPRVANWGLRVLLLNPLGPAVWK